MLPSAMYVTVAMPECGWSPRPYLDYRRGQGTRTVQDSSKVGWRHQARDGSVFLSACPFGDSRNGTSLDKSCLRHKLAFLTLSLARCLERRCQPQQVVSACF